MMRYLKFYFILLSLVLISIFVSPSSAHTLNDNEPPIPPWPTYITVDMYLLDENGNNLGIPCGSVSTNYGCTKYCTDPHNKCDTTRVADYPYQSSTIDVPLETYYLLNVLTTEMNPTYYSQPAALQAQAIAARPYLGNQINNDPGCCNNSISYQAFVPFAWGSLNEDENYSLHEPGMATPCSGELSISQQRACDAIASQHYIAQANNNPFLLPALAMFSSDIETETVDHTTGEDGKPYLKSVKEPISTNCDANTDLVNAHGIGFSQEGANR